MSKIRVTCPRCGHIFEDERQPVYECPKCGTSIREKPKTPNDDFDKTQIFER